MNALIEYLLTHFGIQHDIRFRPSANTGNSNFMLRVTVSNLPSGKEYSERTFTYDLACSHILMRIKQGHGE